MKAIKTIISTIKALYFANIEPLLLEGRQQRHWDAQVALTDSYTTPDWAREPKNVGGVRYSYIQLDGVMTVKKDRR
jgi:hypothetical protein